MGIFGGQNRAQGQRSTTTVIAKGCTLNGQIKLESDIHVDGTVEGQIDVVKTLVISETGFIKGEVHADRVIINGEFEGTCYADNIEILSCGRVSGTIYSDNLSIERGGKFNGVTHAAQTHKNEQQVVDLSDAKIAADAKKTETKKVAKG
ncbi:bactofilin family protein [Vibrio aerogenes]|uniref:bactofilin family protein n=1 Tax=Vibrio aerogenes TaxID=92172 RepID=UPI0009FF87AA|nr:polymer-forming cytoskeletal protein [Vibrio aerogenes]